MGYYTRYSLEVVGPSDPTAVISQLREEVDYAEGCLTRDGSSRERLTWYEHEDDLRAFSKKYPEVLFKLSGEGEEGDIWDKYFKNGKMQLCEAVMIKPPFDHSKLE